MQAFDIYNAVVEWKGCGDMRPWLIVEAIGANHFDCFPISGESYAGRCFCIDENHLDFPATGLTKTCHVHYVSFIRLTRTQFTKPRGRLENELLAQFRDVAGVRLW